MYRHEINKYMKKYVKLVITKNFYQSMWHRITQDSNVYFTWTAQHTGHLRQSRK